jgi:penicillin-binding protein 2
MLLKIPFYGWEGRESVDFLRQRRQVLIFYCFAIAFGLMIYQLWTIQLRDGERFAFTALEQVSRSVQLEEVSRGRILDRNLNPLSGETLEKRAVLFPILVEDKNSAVNALGAILKTDPAALETYFSGGPCILPQPVSDEASEKITNLGLKGVLALSIRARYGGRPLAAQVTGHLGKISSIEEYNTLSRKGKKQYHFNDLVGKSGLELFYEQELKGVRPKSAVRVYYDATGHPLAGGPEIEENILDKERQDLVLTIDAEIQKKVEEIMDRRVAKGAVVVMEAGSGDILALAGRPAYNPGRPEEGLRDGDRDRYFDHCAALYQPGSVFKVVVAAAALEEGVVTPETEFTCNGEEDHLLPCWFHPGHGKISFERAFAESCNPTFARVALKLGAPKLIEFARRMGMDSQQVTGYPVAPDERQNLELIDAPDNLVNSAVGQGPVLTTPLQVASMINTVASGGIYYPPRLVQSLLFDDGRTARRFDPAEGRPVLAPATASTLQRLLEMTTAEGVGREACVPVFGSAGKTGSAQLSGEKNRVNAWFAGYAPLAVPRYVVTVLVEEGASGGESAAPVFKEIIEGILVE